MALAIHVENRCFIPIADNKCPREPRIIHESLCSSLLYELLELVAEVLACFLWRPAFVGSDRGAIYSILRRYTGCLWSYRLPIVSGVSCLQAFTMDTLSELGLRYT